MKLKQLSMVGGSSRPRPFFQEELNGELIVVSTAWGNAEAGKRVADEVVKYISAARGDVEVTSPFQFLSCLSSQENALRVSAFLANDLIWRGENRSEYLSLVELTVLWRQGSKLSWLQCGLPQIFIKKPGRALQALSVVPHPLQDLNFKDGQDGSSMPSLGLGLESTCMVSVGSCLMDRGDQVILLSSALIPHNLWAITDSDMDLKKLVSLLGPQMKDQAFWLGLAA